MQRALLSQATGHMYSTEQLFYKIATKSTRKQLQLSLFIVTLQA